MIITDIYAIIIMQMCMIHDHKYIWATFLTWDLSNSLIKTCKLIYPVSCTHVVSTAYRLTSCLRLKLPCLSAVLDLWLGFLDFIVTLFDLKVH